MGIQRNFAKDLLDSKQLEEYEGKLYPFNLDVLHSALLKKLEEQPDYEVWVPFVYHKSKLHTGTGYALAPYGMIISNKGNILRVIAGEETPVKTYAYEDYWQGRIKLGGGKHAMFTLHRALACAFIPAPEELKHTHPRDLVVNHKDTDKLNYEIDNLEWTTLKGNSEHARDNNLLNYNPVVGADNSRVKPVKGCVMSGPSQGLQFVLIGAKEMKENGFFPAKISECCYGRSRYHRNCTFQFASAEDVRDLPRGIQS